MKLYCVRHGHAEQLPDKNGERPLTQQGEREVSRIADYLESCGVNIIHMMHSGKLRATQTATILAEAVAKKQKLTLCKPLAADYPSTSLFQQLQEWNDDTMLVGHLPLMSILVSLLLLGQYDFDIIKFSPGTVVCLERYGREGGWILNWILHPELAAS